MQEQRSNILHQDFRKTNLLPMQQQVQKVQMLYLCISCYLISCSAQRSLNYCNEVHELGSESRIIGPLWTIHESGYPCLRSALDRILEFGTRNSNKWNQTQPISIIITFYDEMKYNWLSCIEIGFWSNHRTWTKVGDTNWPSPIFKNDDTGVNFTVFVIMESV